jgi:tight adherence protein B
MAVDFDYLILGAIFIVVLLLVEGAFYLVNDLTQGSQRRVNRRLKMLASGQDSEQVLNKLRRNVTYAGAGVLKAMARGSKPVAAFERLVAHSGVRLPINQLLMAMAAAGLMGCALGFVSGGLLGAAAGAMAGGLALPLLYLRLKRARRIKNFGNQLPDAIDIIVRSLRAGHPISTALGMVSEEMKDPIGTEVGVAIDEMTYGLDLREALDNMLARTGHGDLQFLVAAVNIQHGVGGNLSEVLAGLSRVIRERHRMLLKIKALSAEGRISALILSVLPFMVFGFISLTRPEYFNAVKDDPLYWLSMGIGISMATTGILIMYKMVNFRI